MPAYHELPTQLFEYSGARLWLYDPEMLEQLITKHQKPKPLPPGLTRMQRMRLEKLPQYRERSRQSLYQSLGNMTIRVKHMSEDMLGSPPVPIDPEGSSGGLVVPTAIVPAVLGGPDTFLYKNTFACLSKVEWGLFVETWNRWFAKREGDYNYQEDEEDVKNICMETVLQNRIMLMQFRRPETYDPKAYHESTIRMQRARENLGARRADREGLTHGGRGNKVNNNTVHLSVSVLAGKDGSLIEERRAKVIESQVVEQKFLESTFAQTENPLELNEIDDEDSDLTSEPEDKS